MLALVFLLTGFFAPLPPPARAPGTIGVVCVIGGGCAGPHIIRNVDIGIWVMEKSDPPLTHEFDHIISCSDDGEECRVER